VKCIVTLVFASAAIAQQANVTSTRNYDVNGRPVEGVRNVQNNGSRSQITRDVNGRAVPIEAVEERVVSESGGTRVIERVVRRYDPNGRPGPAERLRIEEQKQADGSVKTLTTVSRGDINGSFQVAERSSTLTRVLGDRTESTTSVERPTLNGAFELYERRDEAVTKSGPKTVENATTYRKDPNGRLSEAAKKTREAVAENGVVNENVAEYETASTGRMRLARQSTARVDPTGSREVTVYVPNAEGNLAIFQQQSIQKKETASGSVETTVVRLADPNNAGKLGPPRKTEETVCTGECGKAKPSTVTEVHKPANTK
jgi:hypothetical protein